MTNVNLTVENLMKVSVTIWAGDPPADGDNETPFAFIYGVGPSGITPFEKALFGKRVGDQVQLDIHPTEFSKTVGHLELPLREQIGVMVPAPLGVTIMDVVRAQDRDVIKAMAAGSSCSDCGCGCGGH